MCEINNHLDFKYHHRTATINYEFVTIIPAIYGFIRKINKIKWFDSKIGIIYHVKRVFSKWKTYLILFCFFFSCCRFFCFSCFLITLDLCPFIFGVLIFCWFLYSFVISNKKEYAYTKPQKTEFISAYKLFSNFFPYFGLWQRESFTCFRWARRKENEKWRIACVVATKGSLILNKL